MSSSTTRKAEITAPVNSPEDSTLPPKEAIRPRLFGAFGRIGDSLATAIVFSLLAAIAIWGHRNEWKFPTFSSLAGKGHTPKELWCAEHNVPEDDCLECLKTPLESNYGWCKEHGIAPCSLHHPDVTQLKQVPEITPAVLERTARALALRPRLQNNSRCKLHERRLQFASAEAIEKAGIDVDVVKEQLVIEAIVANGEILYDQTRTAHLSSRVPGAVWRVEKQLGDSVRKGDVLAVVDASDVGRAKGELLQAVAQIRLRTPAVERLRPLAASGTIADRQLREADAALQEAQVKLRTTQQALANLGIAIRTDDFANLNADEMAKTIQFAGLSPEFVNTLTPDDMTSNLLPIRSPLDGMIVERHVVVGEQVSNATNLFTVTDLTHLTLVLDVRQEDAQFVTIGQSVLFRPSDNASGTDITGTVAWISTSADEQTRTVKVRVNLPNAEGHLRANTFGTGRIVLRDEPKSVVVPRDAVHWDGCCHVVFVRDKKFFEPDSPKFFHTRKVRIGVKESDRIEILVGLLPGEVIANQGSTVLEAQLLKSNLGAGCGCTH